MEDGARRPPSYYDITCLNSLFQQITVLQAIVGRGPTRPVLQHPIFVLIIILFQEDITLLMEDEARRPPSYYDITCLNSLFQQITVLQAIVGRGPTRPVLQHPIFVLIIILFQENITLRMEDGARRPSSYFLHTQPPLYTCRNNHP